MSLNFQLECHHQSAPCGSTATSRDKRKYFNLNIFSLSPNIIRPICFSLWNLTFSNTASFFFYSVIGDTRSLISAPSLSGPSSAWGCFSTNLTMLVCYHRAAQSAILMGGGNVVTNQVALLIDVLMGHYSGLYPPPFRLGFHTGRGCAVGITLNKHSNTILLGCVLVFCSLL